MIFLRLEILGHRTIPHARNIPAPTFCCAVRDHLSENVKKTSTGSSAMELPVTFGMSGIAGPSFQREKYHQLKSADGTIISMSVADWDGPAH